MAAALGPIGLGYGPAKPSPDLAADTLRIATFHTELERDGPGLLLRDLIRGADPQIEAVEQVIRHVAPDILFLQGVDYDLELRALSVLRDQIAEGGPSYPYMFSRRPNSGMPTGLDLDGDGRRGEPEDAQGYGVFSGQGGMAILSRYPLDASAAQDFSTVLWRDLPGALLPVKDGRPFPSPAAQAVLRLASVAAWVVPVTHPAGRFDLLSFHAGSPVFDGPEDANGRRNHDQLVFWQHYLDGRFGAAPEGPFILIGDANQDPVDGSARNTAIRSLLGDPRLQDARPERPGGAPFNQSARQSGDPQLDTVYWPKPGPGALRVSYILPSRDWQIIASGVYWPESGSPEGKIAAQASRHRMVWMDLKIATRLETGPVSDPAPIP